MGQKQAKEKDASTQEFGGGGGSWRRPSRTTTAGQHRASDTSKLSKKPSEQMMDGENQIVRKTSSQQAEELNVYANKRRPSRKTSSASNASGYARKNSSQDAFNTGGGGPGPSKTPDIINEDVPQQRRMLFDHLVAFYFRNDHERLMNGDVDVDGLCDWALTSGEDGIAHLNEKLRTKYGEDLDSFLINAAIDQAEAEEEDEEAEEKFDVPPPPPLNHVGSFSSTTSAEEGTESNLQHNAALERPSIPAARRRPTRTQRFALDENGQIATPESAQLDHSPAPDLPTQIKDLIGEKDASRLDEVDKFVKFAEEHGMVALNSELLVAFGQDLKGNTMNDGDPTSERRESNVKKFGIGFDNKVLSEMQNHKLHHEDSSKLVITTDSETGACSKFRLDTESPVFGMCKCGHERAAHIKGASVIKSGTLERKLAARRASINVEATAVQNNNNNNSKQQVADGGSKMVAEIVVPQPTRDLHPINSTDVKPPKPVTPPPSSFTFESKPHKPVTPRVSYADEKPPKPVTPRVSSADEKPPKPANPPPSSAEIKLPTKPSATKTITTATVADVKPPKPFTPRPVETNKVATPRPPRPKSLKKPQPMSNKKTENGDDDKVERLKAGEKKPQPCSIEEFQLDMSASEFGTCFKCGWKKHEHKSSHPDQQASQQQVDKADGGTIISRPRPMSLKKNGPPEPCGHYKLDLTADAFGACVCGFARQAHKGQSSNQKSVSTTLERRWQHMKEIA